MPKPKRRAVPIDNLNEAYRYLLDGPLQPDTPILQNSTLGNEVVKSTISPGGTPTAPIVPTNWDPNPYHEGGDNTVKLENTITHWHELPKDQSDADIVKSALTSAITSRLGL